MNTADTSITSGSIDYSPEQWGSVGPFPIFVLSEMNMPDVGNLIEKKTNDIKSEDLLISEEVDDFESAKEYYRKAKEQLLKKYRGKYIAIFNNQVIDSDEDFSKLAQRVYEKLGYRDIYMPRVDLKEEVVRIPSPRI